MGLKRYFSKYYSRIYYSTKEKFDKLALKQMTSCGKILDVGCGLGRFISQDPKRISGVDGNENSVKQCKEKGFEVHKAKVTKLPFKDASFDGVNCSHVIEHLQPVEAHKLLSEMDRILKRGGIFCLSAPLLHSRFYWDLTHVKPYYPQAILHYLDDNGRQQTLRKIGKYKFLKLKYRRAQLLSIQDSPFWILSPLFNFLSRIGITSFKRDGYLLVLKKLEE
jgi:ubiquinone/menaquinone biosynthesis C-methylase UbiE